MSPAICRHISGAGGCACDMNAMPVDERDRLNYHVHNYYVRRNLHHKQQAKTVNAQPVGGAVGRLVGPLKKQYMFVRLALKVPYRFKT